MFVTNWISTTKIQKISEITNFFRHYFLSRTEVLLKFKEKVVCRKFRQTTQYDALEILIIHLTHGEVWQVCHSKAQDYQVLF